MAKNKNKNPHKHIEDKDKGDAISKIIGDELDKVQKEIMQISFNQLFKDSDTSKEEWYRKQKTAQNSFNQAVSDKLTKEQAKLENIANNSALELGLSNSQTKEIKNQVKTGVNNLINISTSTHAQDVETIKTLKSNVADDLFKDIYKAVETRENLGYRTYKDGRQVKWENWMEMKLRTDIQNDITNNSIKDGGSNGVVFYLTSYYGDCAPDHVDFQGKIYYDENYATIEPTRASEIEAYIKANKLMSIQEVVGPSGNYFTTRPNCRHYLTYTDIDSVLGVKTQDDLKQLREENDLNFNGKYKPDKYQALQQQRANERQIRAYKGKLQTAEKAYDKAVTPKDKELANNNLLQFKFRVSQFQKKQRELLNKNSFLERNYDREAYRRIVSDMGVSKSLKNIKNSGGFKYNEKELEEFKIKANKANYTNFNCDIYELYSDYDYSKYSNIKNPSPYFYHRLRKDGSGHVLEAHPDVKEKVPNYLEVTKEAIKKPDFSKSGNQENSIVIVKILPNGYDKETRKEYQRGLKIVFYAIDGANYISSIHYSSKDSFKKVLRKFEKEKR